MNVDKFGTVILFIAIFIVAIVATLVIQAISWEILEREENCKNMCIAKDMEWNSNFIDMCVCDESEILYRY